MKKYQKPNTRYGVEIKGLTVHAECDELAQILALLKGHEGVVRVFDRENQRLVLDGTVQDVRVSLGEMNGGCDSDEKPHRAMVMSGVASAGTGQFVESPGSDGLRAGTARKASGLNIASAYYFGDLANVTRNVDPHGKETFLRRIRTVPRRALGTT